MSRIVTYVSGIVSLYKLAADDRAAAHKNSSTLGTPNDTLHSGTPELVWGLKFETIVSLSVKLAIDQSIQGP
jgi:hypothetical protein